MKFLIFNTLIFASSCVLLPYNRNTDDKKLPSLYEKDYGTIDYEDKYTLKQSKLNKFWAQEAIATPEARELIKEMQRNNFPFTIPKLGIYDAGFDFRKEGHPRFSKEFNEYIQTNFEDKIIPLMEKIKTKEKEVAKYLERNNMLINSSTEYIAHGTKTIGIIAGEKPVGISSLGKINNFLNAQKDHFEELAQLIKDGIEIPNVVSSSAGSFTYSKSTIEGDKVVQTPVNQDILENAKKVLDKTIYVQPSGNNFPYRTSDLINKIGDKALIVGSADPGGFPSKFSQVSKHVVVLAPSDLYLQSIDANGKIVRYGGTSGAAPIVSGVLSDVKSILPDLTRDEAVHMLKKTATRTTINNMSEVNGAGVVNHYKMLRVAKRLHESGFAENRKLLYDETIYDFSAEARQLAKKATELLTSADNSTSYAEGFKKLRTSFFLDTNNMTTRGQLAKIYEKFGHTVSAELYRVPLTIPNLKLAYKTSEIAKNIRQKSIFRKKKALVKFANQETYNFFKWLRAKGEFSEKEIQEKIIRPISRINTKNAIQVHKTHIEDKLFETVDNQKILHDIIERADIEDVSDTIMRLLLEYADETMPAVFDKPSIMNIVRKKISKFTRILGDNTDLLKKILKMST